MAGQRRSLLPAVSPPRLHATTAAPASENNGCVIALAVVGGIVVVSIVGLLTLGLLFASEVDDATTVAGRDNGVEMTLEEFDQIQNGMTLEQVQVIVGGPGALTSSGGDGEFKTELFSWDGTDNFGANANVSFQNGVVIGKAQVGLQ